MEIHFNKSSIQRNECPVCSGDIQLAFQKERKDSTYSFYKCHSCSFVFVNPTPSEEEIFGHYREYGHEQGESKSLDQCLEEESRNPNSTIDAKRIVRTLIKYLKEGNRHRLLDVGSGYGFFSLEALNNGFEVVPLEIAQNEGKITKELTGTTPLPNSLEDFTNSPSAFDAIIMSQVLEHSREPDRFLKKSHFLLATDGIIAVAVPNYSSFLSKLLGKNDPYIIPPSHLNYFSPRNLGHILESNGFVIIKSHTLSRMPLSSVKKYLKIQVLSTLVYHLLKVAFFIIDRIGCGMFINVYAQKRKPT